MTKIEVMKMRAKQLLTGTIEDVNAELERLSPKDKETFSTMFMEMLYCFRKPHANETPFMTTEKRCCHKCGKIYYYDAAPTNWAVVAKGKAISAK